LLSPPQKDASARTQPSGSGAIDAAVRREDNAIVALGRLARDQPVGHIECDLLRVAFGRIAKAAAARQLEANEIAARDVLPALRAD